MRWHLMNAKAIVLRALGLSLISLLLTASPARAETIRDLFDRANADYWHGDFEAARDLYHDIVSDYRIDNAEVYYNLGNTYMKLDRLGSAMLYFKRALACNPSEGTAEAVRHNLGRARAALVARHHEHIGQNQMLFDESHGAWYALFHMMDETPLIVLFFIFYLGLAIVLLLRHFVSGEGLRRALKPTGWALFGLSLLFGGLLAGHIATTNTVRLGVVIHPDVELRASRLPNAPTVKLPEGLELRLLNEPSGEPDSDTDGDWVRVQLSNGREGLVPSSDIKQI